MFVIGRVVRAALAVCAVAAFAGCSSDDASPDPGPSGSTLDAAAVRAALLRPEDIGPTWAVPPEPDDPDKLVSFCGGDPSPPPAPPGADVVAAPLSDEGQTGAQTLSQYGLVYADAAGATTGEAMLHGLADACPPTVSVPAKDRGEGQEPAYTETAATAPLRQGAWSGFVVTRHKTYDAQHPGTADTAVAVLSRGNVVLVDSYAIYRLGSPSASAEFSSDWQKLVGTVLSRLGG
jgi:hypothetical protein